MDTHWIPDVGYYDEANKMIVLTRKGHHDPYIPARGPSRYFCLL